MGGGGTERLTQPPDQLRRNERGQQVVAFLHLLVWCTARTGKQVKAELCVGLSRVRAMHRLEIHIAQSVVRVTKARLAE